LRCFTPDGLSGARFEEGLEQLAEGELLVVGHHPDDLHANVGRTGSPDRFWSAADIAASLDPGGWEVIVADAPGRSATDLDGRPVTVRDTVMRAARRRGGG
jgi:hypothetical protein